MAWRLLSGSECDVGALNLCWRPERVIDAGASHVLGSGASPMVREASKGADLSKEFIGPANVHHHSTPRRSANATVRPFW